MNSKKETQTMSLQVTDVISVEVVPDKEHEYTMTTSEVAKGYGVAERTIRKHKTEHADELIEGKHFITRGTISTSGKPPVKQTIWTKRGVVKLGFFVRSELAKQFRNLAEDLIVQKMEEAAKPYMQPNDYGYLLELIDKATIVLGTQARLATRLGFSASVFSHLRTMPWLTSDFRKKQIELACKKIITEGAAYLPLGQTGDLGIDKTGILLEICRIEDSEIRMSLVDKLTSGGVL